MKSKTLICAALEYDRTVTSPDRIVRQLNANRRPLGGAELGPFVPLTGGLSLEIQDQSGRAGDQTTDIALIQILQTAYGVDITALNARQERIAGVALDFFDNQIRVLGWDAGSDEPCVVSVLCPDVRAASTALLEPVNAG